MNYDELRIKYNAEEVGDRLIAMVDGQKQYIANKETGGGFSLTYHGLKLEESAEAAAAAAQPEEKPKRKKKAEADSDLLAGLDAIE